MTLWIEQSSAATQCNAPWVVLNMKVEWEGAVEALQGLSADEVWMTQAAASLGDVLIGGGQEVCSALDLICLGLKCSARAGLIDPSIQPVHDRGYRSWNYNAEYW